MFRGLVSAFCLLHGVLAQQYAGQPIPNSLPAVPGAELAFFNVYDGLGRNTTLINYYSAPGGKRPDNSRIQRAIIVLTGLGRNSDGYFTNVHNQIAAATQRNPNITEQNVAIVAPLL
jgi:hypothetical protein